MYRTPTVGITYVAIASKQNNIKHKSIRVQTECYKNNESQVINRDTQPQTSNKNSNKYLENATETLSSQKLITPKPPLYKKTTENTSYKKHPVNQNRKSNNEKEISATLKSSVAPKNPSKKS